MSEEWRRHRRVATVLDEAELLYVAVAGRNGPHVTPAVFHTDGDRLWFITPRRSVKAKVIARRRRVGALVQLGRWSVVMGGRARIVDPLTARGIFTPAGLVDLPFATAGYLSRNVRHAVGTVRDHKAPTLALSRVLISIDVRRAALLDDWAVVEQWGRWDRSDRLAHGALPAGNVPDLSAIPPRLRHLLDEDSPVALGWTSPDGPLALPARWRSGAGELETSGEAFVLAGGAATGPASVCAERSGYRLNSKQGLLFAGQGSAVHCAEDRLGARVTFDARRVTWWNGEAGRTFAVRNA
ncbi:MAG TPA: pyridoxamine 5'-phosphate oxidase family protein [Acidimicrobiia bacterium]|nr:pyridoxamine 5'-phosphate oxidase family protein [Acidimicrobiia bacterium]